ncbi:MAG TPA: ATP synthase F0 subunit C [Thermoanaerobaculia bacterium]|nr:ATP synthase F0 subunit C [Thermoanaerobaculia bacterium]
MSRTKFVLMLLLLVLAAGSVMAQTPFVPTDHPQQGVVRWGVIGAAFVLGIAAAAGAMGQSRAIVAACEGIARNPGAAGPIRLAMIIGLALIESLVIYALLIAFFVYQL